jgi:hypothetical protein
MSLPLQAMSLIARTESPLPVKAEVGCVDVMLANAGYAAAARAASFKRSREVLAAKK